MMKFIEVTYKDCPIFVNCDYVMRVTPVANGAKAGITMSDDTYVTVEESYETVKYLIANSGVQE